MSAPRVLSLLPRRKGRKLEAEGCFRMFPNYRAGRHFIYAIGFVGGVVKVGQSRDPRGRLLQHARSVGGEVVWAHVFEGGSMGYANGAEYAVVEALGKVCQRINRSEWFHCDDKALVIRTIRPLLAVAKETAARWDRERDQAAARSAKAAQLLAEYEAKQKAAKVATAAPIPAEAA